MVSVDVKDGRCSQMDWGRDECPHGKGPEGQLIIIDGLLSDYFLVTFWSIYGCQFQIIPTKLLRKKSQPPAECRVTLTRTT